MKFVIFSVNNYECSNVEDYVEMITNHVEKSLKEERKIDFKTMTNNEEEAPK